LAQHFAVARRERHGPVRAGPLTVAGPGWRLRHRGLRGRVEVAQIPASAVAVRDSKDPDGPRLVVAPDEWRAFVAGVKAGEFGLS